MNIRELLISYIEETENLASRYSIKGTIDPEKFNTLIELLENYLQKQLIIEASSIKINGASPYTFHQIEDVKNNTIGNSQNIDIEIILLKNNTDNWVVFSIDTLKETLKKNPTNQSAMIGVLNKFFQKNTILCVENDELLLTYIKEEETAKEYLSEVHKIIQFSSSEQLKISPHNIDLTHIKDINSEVVKEFYNLANGLKNFLSLLYIASNIDIRENTIQIVFDGNRERFFNLSGEDIIDKFNMLDRYKELFFWIYKKESDEKNQNFIEKLEIVRNLIAITFVEDNSLILLNESVYDILKKSTSNYKIYLKSKTKDYFELRFKIEEHTDKLFNSLGDELTQFTDFFRNNLYVFIGIIFSTVIFTILRSQSKSLDTINQKSIFLNQDLSIVISIYGFFSLLVLLFSTVKVFSNFDDLNKKLNSMKEKYSSFIDKKDLSSIIGKSFENRKSKNIKWISGIVFIWLIIGILLIFNSKIFHYIYSKQETAKVESNQTNQNKKSLLKDINLSSKDANITLKSQKN